MLPEESPASTGQGARQDWRRKFASQGEEVALAYAGATSESATETIPPSGQAALRLLLPAAVVFAFPDGKGEKVG